MATIFVALILPSETPQSIKEGQALLQVHTGVRALGLGKPFFVKGTVSVISSDLPFKEGNARLTTVPIKALSDEHELEA